MKNHLRFVAIAILAFVFVLTGCHRGATDNVPVTGITLNKASTTILVGSTEQLTATIAPLSATNQNSTWSTSDASKATVSSNGLVTAVAEGTAVISATTIDGGFTASCSVSIGVLVQGTMSNPIPISANTWTFSGDTNNAPSDAIDNYPPSSQNASGPEYIFSFTLDHPVVANMALNVSTPTDIDLFLLSSITPLTVIAYHGNALSTTLQPGTYYLVADTFVSAGAEMKGPFYLTVTFEETPSP
jgi:hypothetical protein